MTITSRVRGLGVFDVIPGSRVRNGESFVVYVELVNWPSTPEAAGRGTARASDVVRILDANGLPVVMVGPKQSSYTAAEPLDGLFVARTVTVPSTLPPGPYTVEIEATDPATGMKARASVPLAVMAPAE
jgi:hypothetical protein